MFDYTELVNTAKELVQEFGRTTVFQKLSGAATDPSKPWEGAGTTVVIDTTSAFAVFVPAQGSSLGKDLVSEDLLKAVDQVAIVEPVASAIDTFHQIVDGSITYKIEWVQVLKPANEILLYVVGVKQ